jgi:hypothetical protein
VERSSDGVNWKRIGQVSAKNTAAERYVFTDDFPVTGLSYYRLRVDRNGSAATSPVCSVYFDIPELIVVYPNPVNEVLSIRIQNETVSYIELIDLTGRMFESRAVVGKGMTWNLQSYVSGVYSYTGN